MTTLAIKEIIAVTSFKYFDYYLIKYDEQWSTWRKQQWLEDSYVVLIQYKNYKYLRLKKN